MTKPKDAWDLVVDQQIGLKPVDSPSPACANPYCEGECFHCVTLAELATVKAERDRIVGEVQRLQPAGSPPPGNAPILVSWIVRETAAKLTRLQQLAEELEARGTPSSIQFAEQLRQVMEGKE